MIMDDTATQDIFSIWREEGPQQIRQNFGVFRNLLDRAKDHVKSGKYEAAAVYAEMAADYASWEHCGFFVSPELERVLISIGQQAIETNNDFDRNRSLAGSPRRILHVASSVRGIGGLSRMIWRWVREDTASSHSLVLTRQFPDQVPQAMTDAIDDSHGKIHILNKNIGSILTWARQLRKLSASADLVVLHVANHDVVPLIAFAHKEQSPPIIFLDHADHQFWLGASISDVVVSLRDSGMRLANQRRGIEESRSVILPIILEPTHRTLSPSEAKQKIGVPEDSILLLSIARSLKYKTMDGVSFADAHLPLLKKYSQAILVVIGPDRDTREEWSAAIEQTQGRIKVLEEREDTAIFYQAADIYVDSFPYVSITSLLEAGSYDVPLVSRYPYPSDACAIFGADIPGLTGNLIQARNLDEYTEVLSNLVKNNDLRQSLGAATRKQIIDIHTQSNWKRFLQEVYIRADTIPRITVSSNSTDQMFIDEPDVFLPFLYKLGDSEKGNRIHREYLRIMPFNQRFSNWLILAQKYGFYKNPPHLLLPEWVRSWYRYGLHFFSKLLR
jgi:glycosyltransferase involved in cell wall biosynthesis